MLIDTVVECTHSAIGHRFPAQVLVAVRPANLDGEAAVEQFHPPVGPRSEVAVAGWRHVQIIFKLFEYVDKALRQRVDVWRHREAQSHCVAWSGIGVLAHDEHTDGVEGNGEGAQYVPAGGGDMFAMPDTFTQQTPHMANLRLHRAQRLGPPRIHEFLKRFDFGHVSTLARSCNSRLLAAMDRSAWTSAAGIRVRWPL